MIRTREQFLHCCMIGLDFFLCIYLGFYLSYVLYVSIGHFVLVLLAFCVLALALVSSVLSQEIGWQETEPDPTGGACSAPPDPLAGFKRAYL